jgi:histidyl-tRNA synthetase
MEGARTVAPHNPMDAYLVHGGERASTFAWRVAEGLRERHLKVALHCGGGSFKSQMKRADASGARFAVIIGDDEADRQVLSLKPLRELAEQIQVSLDEAVELMRPSGR